MATLGRRIADWVHGISYAALPDKTVHEAKRRILDSIGTCLGAYHVRPAKVARAVAQSVVDTRAGIVWGTHHSTLPELAAFANGAMVRYLDFNDTYLSKEPAHPSDNIAATLAVAPGMGPAIAHLPKHFALVRDKGGVSPFIVARAYRRAVDVVGHLPPEWRDVDGQLRSPGKLKR